MDSKTANDSIQTECKETIEQILQFYECDSSIQLKMMIETAGSNTGDNYMSVVKRLIVSGCHDTSQNQNQNGKCGFNDIITIFLFYYLLNENKGLKIRFKYIYSLSFVTHFKTATKKNYTPNNQYNFTLHFLSKIKARYSRAIEK